MTHGYTEVGDAIYAVMDGLNITDLADDDWAEDGWAERYNTLPKQVGTFPSFSVSPVSDQLATLDSQNDSDTMVYSVYVFDSFYDAQRAEDRMRQLVDLVRERFRVERGASPCLGLTNVYDVTLSGEWGTDIEHGFRFYRLGLSVRVRQELE